jgi:hypothetical protein
MDSAGPSALLKLLPINLYPQHKRLTDCDKSSADKHKALATEDSYIFWLRRYISAVRNMPKDLSSKKKLERFLTELALRDHVAASTQNQAFNSVVFFYRKPVIHLSREGGPTSPEEALL